MPIREMEDDEKGRSQFAYPIALTPGQEDKLTLATNSTFRVKRRLKIWLLDRISQMLLIL